MRKHLTQDFDSLYIVDLKGNVRKDSMRDGIPIGEKNTVFGLSAMVGISISVLVRNRQAKQHKISYADVDWKSTRQEKFEYLDSAQSLGGLEPRTIVPNTKHTWLTTDTEDEFEAYIPIGSNNHNLNTVFSDYCIGVQTSRDAYVYGFEQEYLLQRTKRFVDNYNVQVDKYKRQSPKPNVDDFVDYETVDWSSTLKRKLISGHFADYSKAHLRNSLYRPFARRFLYYSDMLVHRPGHFSHYFPDEQSESENQICLKRTRCKVVD